MLYSSYFPHVPKNVTPKTSTYQIISNAYTQILWYHKIEAKFGRGEFPTSPFHPQTNSPAHPPTNPPIPPPSLPPSLRWSIHKRTKTDAELQRQVAITSPSTPPLMCTLITKSRTTFAITAPADTLKGVSPSPRA